MTECTLALAQIESSCLDQRGNLEKMIAYARRAEEAGADLLCFPGGRADRILHRACEGICPPA